MTPRRLLLACFLLLLLTLVIKASPPAAAAAPGETRGPTAEQTLDCGGEPCAAVLRGLVAFLDRRLEGLDGNGRSCADCHMPTDRFQLSPANADARFRLLQLRRRWNPDADDPLFRPVDADDFRINGESASDYTNLRQNGLIRVTMPLPSNIKLIDPVTNLPSTDTFVDVWRAVPTVNDVALTGPGMANPWPRGPNQTGGYQLDGRFETLQEQALAALNAHAQIRNAPLPATPRRPDVLSAGAVHEPSGARARQGR